MTKKTYDEYDTYTQTKRIADALEEILRLVKADQEKMEKRRLREPDDVTGELWKEKDE